MSRRTPSAADAAHTVEGVLDALRRAPRQVARNPKAALEHAAAQLMKLAQQAPRSGERGREYRIDDLAQAAGMTTRNVRAYQERGLLPGPRRSGRIALFNDTHLSRLKLIGSMLERGYTTAHIHEMLEAWQEGRDLGDVLGLEDALVAPRAGDAPETMPLAKVRDLAGGSDGVDTLVAAGLVEVDGNRALVQRPRLLRSFAAVRAEGVSLEDALAVHHEVLPLVEQISRSLIDNGLTQLAASWGENVLPEDLSALVQRIGSFRDIAVGQVLATLEFTIERDIENLLTAYLSQLVEVSSGQERPEATG